MRRARLELAVSRSVDCRSRIRHTIRRRTRTERSPGRRACHPLTNTPSAAMRPASSCPATCGSATPGSWPCQLCQCATADTESSTSITTPSGAGSGWGASPHLQQNPNSLKVAVLTLVRVARLRAYELSRTREPSGHAVPTIASQGGRATGTVLPTFANCGATSLAVSTKPVFGVVDRRAGTPLPTPCRRGR